MFALAAMVTVAAYYPPESFNVATGAVALVGGVVGSLLPDIDQASNRLWDLLPAGDILGRFFRRIFLAHRTISHSILGIFIVYEVVGWLLPKILNPDFIYVPVVWAAVMIGFISHIFLDGFTEEGVPLFFPLRLKIGFPPIASWRIKTGKGFEKFVVFPGILVYIVWFVSSNYEKLNEGLKLVVR